MKWTTKLYWLLFALVLGAGLTATIYFGLQPRPVPKIQISKFQSDLELANSLVMRLNEEIKDSRVIFLGVQPERPDQLKVWQAFLKQSLPPEMQYSVVVLDQYLPNPELFPEAERFDTKEQAQALFSGIQQALQSGKRVAVIVPNIYSVQKVAGNLVNRLSELLQPENKPEILPTSLSLADFPRDRSEERSMVQPCVVEGVDETGYGPWGCMVLQAARANYRKRFEKGQWIGLVNLIGLRDYMVLYTQER